jgi:hypothetical protein
MMTDSSFSLASPPTGLAFIDAAVADSASLVSQFQPGTEVHLLNSSEDAIGQITSILAGRSGITSLHIVSHGSDGALQLGGETVDDLSKYDAELSQWSNSLTAHADILLYGCNVAADPTGKAFVQQLATLTGADVAASTDLTGSSALGGDWDLEFSTGSIEASGLLLDWAQAAYQSVLATYAVTTTNDVVDANDGVLSLREAIAIANASIGVEDTINFGVSGTITLNKTLSQLLLTDSARTTINGGNAITVSGGGETRVFQVGAENNTSATATLNGLIISGGTVGRDQPIPGIPTPDTGLTGEGGGISNYGTLTVNNSTISGNLASRGGGISNEGTLTVNNSTLSNNRLRDNIPFGTGGGIYNEGTLTVSNSTLSGNNGRNEGGGILNFSGEATVSNSTLSGNGAGNGGGISNISGLLRLRNSTVTANSAGAGQGSGVRSVGNANTRTEVVSSIIAGNSSSDVDFVFSTTTNSFASLGNNLIGTGDATGNFNQTGDQTGITTPGLAALANNGGPTQTHALLSTSPAVNKGSNPDSLTTDQRGSARVQGGTIDIGAFESAFLPPNSAPTTTGIATVTVNEDAAATTINLFDAFADAETPDSGLSYSVTANSNPGLVSTSLSSGNLSLAYAANAFGTANLTVRATDPGGLFVDTSFTVNVTAVNDAPVVNLTSTSQSILSSNSLISGITVSDIDAGTSPVSVTLRVNSGSLNVATTPNVTIGNNSTSTVTLTGSISAINTALTNLRYTGSNNFSGNDSLTVTVNDNGNTGSGPAGGLSDSKSVALSVARDLGTLGVFAQTVSGSVNATDPVDFYQVTLTAGATLFPSLFVLTGDADLAILDSTGNVIASSNNPGLQAEVIQRAAPAGTYRIRVRRFTGSTNYNLVIAKY